MSTHREETIFQAAREIHDLTARVAFLDQVCAGDDALRADIESLLSTQTEAVTLTTTAAETVRVAPLERAGDTIGRYKLLQQIGEGGCGVVYMAEQSEPVRRKVALKVIKVGMDTKKVIARFEAERQALAMMDHANIAKVLDAGATDNGRPYFVMELVRGIPITQYCDENNLRPPQRLGLFIAVCHAIQHAHQKGIIHRDIKPSNILVTMHDAMPVPKVIDFGVAKATEARLTDLTLFTELHAFIGTPAYMSPEQAEMSGLDIDTRADIYSLGVLLYELLSGRLPFDPKALLKAGLDAMRHTIREVEPPRPSTRLGTLTDAERSAIAKQRGLDPGQLSTQLRGDLDWIVMKCLEKDRTRRYETANGLALDLKRYLGNEAVLARPPSTAYLLGKLMRRRKTAFAAGSAVVLALIGGIAVSSWQAVRATRAEREAKDQRQLAETARSEAEREKARALELIRFMDAEVGQAFVDAVPVQLRERVSARVDAFYTEHGALASLDDEERMGYHIRKALVHFAAIKRYEGENMSASTRESYLASERRSAASALNEALRLGENLAAKSPGDRCITRDRILIRCHLATLATQLGDTATADAHLRAAREIFDSIVRSGPFPLAKWIQWMDLPTLNATGGEPPRDAAPAIPPALEVKAFDPQRGHANGLGMRFVPVPGTNALCSVFQTRVRDFRTFIRETGYVHMRETADQVSRMRTFDKDGTKQRGHSWEDPGFAQTEDHPVVGVSWHDAKAFCEWLTLRERAVGRLPGNWEYRLPTDHEWSVAVGLADEDATKSVGEKDGAIKDRYPWGQAWPPPPGAGNFAGSEARDAHWPEDMPTIEGYNDGFVRTAPVGSFQPNRLGIYDLGGNVVEWCEDRREPKFESRVMRGISWNRSGRDALLSSRRSSDHPGVRNDRVGFRCVASRSVPASP